MGRKAPDVNITTRIRQQAAQNLAKRPVNHRAAWTDTDLERLAAVAKFAHEHGASNKELYKFAALVVDRSFKSVQTAFCDQFSLSDKLAMGFHDATTDGRHS